MMGRFDYLRLMDIASLLFVPIAVLGIADVAGVEYGDDVDTALAVMALLWWLLAFHLVSTGPKRDEFIRSCWHSAAGTTMKALLTLPLLSLIIAAFTEGLIAGFRGGPDDGTTWLDAMSAGDTITVFWLLLFAVFLTSFQIARFRGPK